MMFLIATGHLSFNVFDSITYRHPLGLTLTSEIEILLALEFPPEAIES